MHDDSRMLKTLENRMVISLRNKAAWLLALFVMSIASMVWFWDRNITLLCSSTGLAGFWVGRAFSLFDSVIMDELAKLTAEERHQVALEKDAQEDTKEG